MRKWILVAALAMSLPVWAQTQTVQFTYPPVITGTLTTNGDFVQLNAPGSEWATVVWSVIGTAGTASVNAEVSVDGGVNFSPAPYSKRLNVVTGNPLLSNIVGATLVTGTVWETPLPSNNTQFRVRCSGTGTTSTVQLNGGMPYVPTTPVVAVLYDNSVTAGASLTTTTFDVTGWRQVVSSVVITTAATGAASLNIVDDTGATIAIGTSASIAIGTFAFGWGDSGTFGTANPFTMVGGVTALPLDRRFNIVVAGATTSATRVRVVARR